MSIAKTIPFIVLMVKSGQMKLHVRWRTHKNHEPKQTVLPKNARLTADVFICLGLLFERSEKLHRGRVVMREEGAFAFI